MEACRLVPITLSLYDPRDVPAPDVDRDINRLSDIKFQKILRYTTQAKHSGGYLTYADLGYLLGTHPEAISRLVRTNPKVAVPLRGSECDIGRGITHRKKIIRLYLEMHTETEIVARTGHSYEAIENYIKEFAAVLVLAERGLTVPLIRRVTGRSVKLINTYLELIREYSGPEYAFRLHHLRKVFELHEDELKKACGAKSSEPLRALLPAGGKDPGKLPGAIPGPQIRSRQGIFGGPASGQGDQPPHGRNRSYPGYRQG